MEIALFASWEELLSGLFVGICFGFLLRKAHVTRFHVIVKQLLLEDFTVMKVMMTAIGAGCIGIAVLRFFQPELLLDITATTLKASIVGGAVFGVGMALLGYCPGTAIGAFAEGTKDAGIGILGMIAGAAVYAECAEWAQMHFKPVENLVRTTIPEYFGISTWGVIAGFIFCGAVALVIMRGYSKKLFILKNGDSLKPHNMKT